MKTHQFNGRCHCGNISYQFDTDLNLKDFGIRKCDCSFCSKHGSRYISDPAGSLMIKIENRDLISFYQFASKTADFICCTNCGVTPVVTCKIEEQLFGIVNLYTLDKAEHFGRHAQENSYDGESVTERLERRQQNWIGQVTIQSS